MTGGVVYLVNDAGKTIPQVYKNASGFGRSERKFRIRNSGGLDTAKIAKHEKKGMVGMAAPNEKLQPPGRMPAGISSGQFLMGVVTLPLARHRIRQFNTRDWYWCMGLTGAVRRWAYEFNLRFYE